MIKYSKLCILVLVSMSVIFTNTRVGFSRPGSIIRTPGKAPACSPFTLVTGSSMELLNISELNYSPAIYFHALNVRGFNFGISYFTHAISNKNSLDESRPHSLNFSVDKQVFQKENMTVSVGVHDILYDSPADHRLSIFANFSHYYQINEQYNLETTIGFGSGFLSEDSHDYNYDNNSSPANFFTSLKFNTPWLQKSHSNLKLLMEYDGWGLNLGASIPVADNWTIDAGITHFEKISKFQDWESDGSVIDDAPAIVLGFQMTLPSVDYSGIVRPNPKLNSGFSYNSQNQELDSLIAHANSIITSLEDTLMLQNIEKDNLQNLNLSLSQKINALNDSLNGLHLEGRIFQDNLNTAMKHLSRSLDRYYNEDYVFALSEVDKALEVFPDLAISYARKGSIYYKIGDLKRATINWNLALKLDPEYVEVKNILVALKNQNVDINQLPE